MMKEQAVISVIIPTYNRKEYLELTLNSFSPQIARNKDKVEVVVCNNASTDGTDDFLIRYAQNDNYFRYINFDDHVNVGESIVRSNNEATGKYILMWGDDDIPAPFLIDVLLDAVLKFPDICLFHYNRLYGQDNHIKSFNNVRVLNAQFPCKSVHESAIEDLIESHILDMTFLSSILFLNETWKSNDHLDCSSHFGYEFLGRILHGSEGKKALYINYPLCIQRKPMTRSWMEDSPKYRFIGLPNMYRDFEKWGLIGNAEDLWERQGNSFRDFLAVMSQTCLYKRKYRKLFFKMLESQKKVSRKVLTFIFIFLFPAPIYKFIRKRKFGY